MSTFIYCARPSDGAKQLADALGAQRVRKFDGMDFWRKGRRLSVTEGDVVVCWGASFPEVEGLRLLNQHAEQPDKRNEASLLGIHKIPTIPVLAVSPQKYIRDFGRSSLENPDRWVGRSRHHTGGDDLLNPPQKPDFWVERLSFIREVRVHHFNGRSIRAGEKVHREDFENPHPWIRTFDAGWKISYDGFQTTKQMRLLAKKAVAALGYTFGAVDIGEQEDGKLIVLEVNKAPGLEGNTVTAYANAIKRWIDGPGRAEGDVEE